MSPVLDKILIHETVIMELALLPFVTLSEKATEALNKDSRQFRENSSRKFCQVQCNTDVLNRLLLKSDPNLRGTYTRSGK